MAETDNSQAGSGAPLTLACSACNARIDKIHTLGPEDFGDIPGLEIVLRGTCPECNRITWDIRGDQQACAAFLAALGRDVEDD